MLTDFGPDRMLNFGVEPACSGSGVSMPEKLDFASALDDESGKRVVWFVQLGDTSPAKTLITKVLKAAFFSAALRSEKRTRPDHGLPLAAYIADECHRFITCDPSHGEQSFLDTCRSYGVYCVLACQSIHSLRFALSCDSGSTLTVDAPVNSLLANTGTKLVFRTSDWETQNELDRFCPGRPGEPKVTHLRPATGLEPGEVYASLVDGRFDRCQLEQWVPDNIRPTAMPAGGSKRERSDMAP